MAEIIARESPFKRRCGLFVALLKVQEPLLELGQGREVIGGERLSLHDGEVNLDLVEPTGVNRGVHQDDVRPFDHSERRRWTAFWPRCAEQLSMIQKTRFADW